MLNIKRISIIASFFLLIGIVGSVFTFNSVNKAEEMTKEKIINNDEYTNIDIRADNARIDILPAPDDVAKVELSTKDPDYHLSTQVKESTLKVQVEHKQRKLFNFNIFSFGTRLTVYVPEQLYDLIQVKSDNGKITGNNLQATTMIAETDNGLIELEHIDASAVQAKTANGKIVLDQVEGDISGRTSNGKITFVTGDLDRSIDLETDNGKIDIQTGKEPTNAMLDVRVDNGSVKIFGDSNWDTVVGNGDHTIKLRTGNGRITVTKNDNG